MGAAMARVSTTTDYVDLDGDYGTVAGVEVTCDRCGHSEESFGTDEPSLLRCAALLRENCPKNEKNYYDVSP
jgi:hypothetical protein